MTMSSAKEINVDHWEIENEAKQLVKQGQFEDALEILLQSVENTEIEAENSSNQLYTNSFEESAKIFRKLKRYEDEVYILERFLSNSKAAAEPRYPEIAKRLEKACLLAGKAEKRIVNGVEKVFYLPEDVSFENRRLFLSNGLIVDVETTGFDVKKDEIVELGAVLFSYNRITKQPLEVTETYAGLREPSKSIPSGATKVHGLRDADVYGESFDENIVQRMFAVTDYFIAHNASFDRRFLSQLYPLVDEKEWYCSMNGIDWKGYGHQSKALQKLVTDFQISVDDSHRGLDDAMAVYSLLLQINELTQKTYLEELLSGFSEPINNKEKRLPKLEDEVDISFARPKKSFWEFLFGKRS